ncbi:MAG: peptidase T, partial [Chitinophagaceae bacterium]|nr:peptidase T [Chitinophagaceae bacterium]
MFKQYEFTVAERFMRYVKIDTQSDPQSDSCPSTEKQKNLSRLLVQELKDMGIQDAELDEHGYVYATIVSNVPKKIPVICFCAHVDTAPDCSGTGVKPILHRNYDGKDIVLPDDHRQVIRVDEHPYLKNKMGEDIITASGTTLLGADDKAGVAVIMDMVNFFATHSEVKHGDIRILFTPDEEIGRGVDKADLKKLGADFGYTLDGGERGQFEDETFSADSLEITFHGVSAHPGYAKGKMKNAIKVAAAFLESLPAGELAPEVTEGRDGFVHPVRICGIAEAVSVQFILRDFNTAKLPEYASLLQQKAKDAIRDFEGVTVSMETKVQYRNMKEVLNQHPKVSEYAIEAIRRAGISP